MHRQIQNGELVVIGNDQVEIPLQDLPHRVEVFFKPKHEPPTCEHGHHHHHHHDHVEWEVERRRHGHTYVLEIKWRVHDVREIVWSVSY